MGRQDSAPVRGKWGENLAALHLEQAGCKILEKNYKRITGEVDIICRDGDCLVFVEVKTWFNTPVDDLNRAISPRKQNRIRKTAMLYLQDNPLYESLVIRFDIILINSVSGVVQFCNAF